MKVAPYWRIRKPLLRLEGTNHSDCGIKHFPPVRNCPDCAELKRALSEGDSEAAVLALFDFSLKVSNIAIETVEKEGLNPERRG